MATFLFNEIIFGPVTSRRLGASLGINLLPNTSKLCNYNCIYCECGWTPSASLMNGNLHKRTKVSKALQEKLHQLRQSGRLIDTITFAGNGEPTIHPDFAGIIDDTITIRDKYFPDARIAVLSNSSMVYKPDIFNALLRVDDNILKLDSAFAETNVLMNQPKSEFKIDQIIENMRKFDGRFILQTMFLKGRYQSKSFDNTSEKELLAWRNVVNQVKPRMVMIYTIARDTPHYDLTRIPAEKLNEIAELIKSDGYKVQVSS